MGLDQLTHTALVAAAPREQSSRAAHPGLRDDRRTRTGDRTDGNEHFRGFERRSRRPRHGCAPTSCGRSSANPAKYTVARPLHATRSGCGATIGRRTIRTPRRRFTPGFGMRTNSAQGAPRANHRPDRSRVGRLVTLALFHLGGEQEEDRPAKDHDGSLSLLSRCRWLTPRRTRTTSPVAGLRDAMPRPRHLTPPATHGFPSGALSC